MLRDSRKKIERNKDIRLEREREKITIICLGGVSVGVGFFHWDRSCHHFVVVLVRLSWRGRRTPSPLQTDLL